MTQNIFSENRGESIKEHTTEIDNFILQYVLYANPLSSEQRYAYSIFASCTYHEESESAYAYDITSLRETADHIFDLICRGLVTPCTLFDVLENLL